MNDIEIAEDEKSLRVRIIALVEKRIELSAGKLAISSSIFGHTFNRREYNIKESVNSG